jgi:hypothetical protein
MQKTEAFIAGVERDVQVIEAISKTLSILEMVNEMTSVVGHSAYRLDFTSEIARLNGALRMMGARDNDRPLRPQHN